jgi:choline-sulfatase
MVDQLAAGWLPAYGHPIVKAPTTSALAHRGVVFESAYCPSPLCAPSRAALLTGRLPSRTGVFDNGAELRASLPTIAHHLRAAGYATCLAGKMHFVGPDQLHGFEERLTTDIYPAGLDWTPDWRLPAGEHVPWYHTMESVLSPGICTASMQLDYDDEVAFRAVRRIFDFARAGAREPFFFVVSFSSPHDPWEVRREYWDRYDPDAIDPPAVPMIPPSEADPYSLRLREMIGIDEAGLSDEQVRTARHGYYAAISYVDERIGEVLGALRAGVAARPSPDVPGARRARARGRGHGRLEPGAAAPRVGKRRPAHGGLRVSRRGRHLAGGDDPPRPAQVHRVRGRSRPALRPGQRPPRAREPSR